jgi:hypothetical protein
MGPRSSKLAGEADDRIGIAMGASNIGEEDLPPPSGRMG